MGMCILESDENECECLTSSRSRESPRSSEGIVICRLVSAQPKAVVVGWRAGGAELGVRFQLLCGAEGLIANDFGDPAQGI
jgi:hypothetical protein